VEEWKDRSGNSIDFEQSTPINQPFFFNDAGNNNMPVLLFSYGTLLRKPAGGTFGTSGTLFFVFRATIKDYSNYILLQAQGTPAHQTRIRVYPEGKFNLIPTFGGTATSDAATDVTEGITQIIGFRSGSPFTWTTNGRALMASPGNATGGDLYTAGNYLDVGSYNTRIMMYDFIAFDSELSDANYNAVQGYLGDKYGITVADI
jgi:hypothetical protein